MIDIHFIENTKQLLPEYERSIKTLLASNEVDQAKRYRRWQDKQAYLLGKFLLATLLKKHGYSEKLLKDIHYSEFKRPYIPQVKGDFNISHAGDFVTCAFSDNQKIGIDIERIQQIDMSIYNYILNDDDGKRIAISTNKYITFFDIWSAKEAILKAHGCGLVNDLDKIEVNDEVGIFEHTIYHLKKLPIHSDYSSVVASLTPIKISECREVFIEEFSTL